MQSSCTDRPPTVGRIASRSSHVFAVSAIAATGDATSAAIHIAAHSWPNKPPHLPVLALAPSRWLSNEVLCSSNNRCCTAALQDPRSPGKHAVIIVSQSPACHSPPPPPPKGLWNKVNLTIGIVASGSATLKITLADINVCYRRSEVRQPTATGVCLGPIFQSPARAGQQQHVWARWMEHAQRIGIHRVFAYGIDAAARQAFGSSSSQLVPSGLDVTYSDWPRAWHESVGLPLTGNASQTARLSVSTLYVTQPLVLQKCFIDHAHEVEWLVSMDTDEFFQAAMPLHLPTYLRSQSSAAQHAAVSGGGGGGGVVSLCRGQAFRNGSWFQLAASKYAIRTAACSNDPMAYAWVHYGWCGGPKPNHSASFDHSLLAQQCGLAPRQGYLDHSWRSCLMESRDYSSGDKTRTCGPLRSYPSVSYEGVDEEYGVYKA